jgi:hypothetical protein
MCQDAVIAPTKTNMQQCIIFTINENFIYDLNMIHYSLTRWR